MSNLQFYLAQADKCEADAATTSLVNVRERHLRAREAWLQMADRIERTATSRAEVAEAKILAATTAAASPTLA
jgi:hypothetical protein